MKLIPLTRGKFAQVDDADYESLSQFKWYAKKSNRTYYAWRKKTVDGKTGTVKMHNVVLNLTDYSLYADHIDRDGLNNTRQNLRVATRQQNAANKNRYANNSTGYIGVSGANGKWKSNVRHNGTHIHLGTYSSPEKAAQIRDAKAFELWGEFAYLNFPRPRIEFQRAA